MKNVITIMVAFVALGFTVITTQSNTEVRSVNTVEMADDQFEIPADIQIIIDKSCVMCHNTDSKNTKGKLKLDFDSFTNGQYSTGKLVGKLSGIAKVLDKGSMPPEKFLAKYPDKALTADESKALKDWATSQATALAGE